jgi:hypothetical protein
MKCKRPSMGRCRVLYTTILTETEMCLFFKKVLYNRGESTGLPSSYRYLIEKYAVWARRVQEVAIKDPASCSTPGPLHSTSERDPDFLPSRQRPGLNARWIS